MSRNVRILRQTVVLRNHAPSLRLIASVDEPAMPTGLKSYEVGFRRG